MRSPRDCGGRSLSTCAVRYQRRCSLRVAEAYFSPVSSLISPTLRSSLSMLERTLLKSLFPPGLSFFCLISWSSSWRVLNVATSVFVMPELVVPVARRVMISFSGRAGYELSAVFGLVAEPYA